MSSKILPPAFWPAVLAACLLPTLGTWLYFDALAGTGPGKACHLGIKLFVLLFPILATAFLFREKIPNFFARANRPLHRRAILPGAILGLAIVGVAVILLLTTPLGPAVLAAAPEVKGQVQAIGVVGWFIPFALLLSVAHSAMEEYYWRWFVFGNLARALPLPWAHGLAALAFAGHHIVVLCQFFPTGIALFLSTMVGVGGLLWSLLYRHQRTLMGAWVSHMVVDAGIMAIGYYLIYLT